MNKLFYLLILVLSVNLLSFAQKSKPIEFNKLKRAAKEAEREGEIYLALEYYEQVLSHKHHVTIKDHLHVAHLYRYTRNYIEAEKNYKIVCESEDAEDHPDAFFYLATMQKANKKYEEAKGNLKLFTKNPKYVKFPTLKTLKRTELDGCDLGISIKDSTPVAVVNVLNSEVNSSHIDFSPVPVSENKIIYGSLKEEEVKHYNVKDSIILPKRKLYEAIKESDQWMYKGVWDVPFNEDSLDIGNGSFSLDKKRFYFTRCFHNWQYKIECEIYFSEKSDQGWSTPEKLDDQINLHNYTSSHPSIGRESKRNREVIYFVSDRPGGKGGTDIWYTEFNERRERYSKPRSVGARINTVGDELTPYYDAKTRTLYFSTNGRTNIGGLDIFKIKGEKSKWEKASNVGAPINSSADDLEFVLNESGKSGYFASNRKGGHSLYNETCCDDIYEFVFSDFIDLELAGSIIDKESAECLTEGVLNVYIKSEDGKYLANSQEIDNCQYVAKLSPGHDYIFEIVKDKYFNSVTEFSTKNMSLSDTILMDFELEKIPVEPILLKSLNYDFNSAVLKDEGEKYLDTTLLVLLKENQEIIVEISSHTDNKGSDAYNLRLSQRRAESVMKYLQKNGIAEKRMVAKGYGETQPIMPNENEDGTDNEEGRRLNRRTEFKIVGKIDPALIHYETIEEKQANEKRSRRRNKDQEDE